MKTMIVVGLIVSASGCAIDEGDEMAPEVGVTEHELNGWLSASWGTTSDLVGLDTGLSATTTTCVLSMVRGDLGEGGYWQSTDVVSGADVSPKNGNWFLYGHGGAYTNQVNQRVWANNKVNAGASCALYPKLPVSQPTWRSANGYVTLPQKLAPLATNRRCFLGAIYGGGQIFTHASDYVRVRPYTTTDATHPTTGWYVEGSLKSNPYSGQPASASGTCIDFPAIEGEWGGSFGDATYTLTTGTGTKMCGLQGVYGAFNVDSWDNGVKITAPSTLTGNWTMTVSPGKWGEATCIQ